MQKRLTIKDIARLCGVSKSTISRVLNHESNVDPHTRERVAAVIREYGFTPSKSARAMRGQSDKVVGIIISRLDSSSENQAVRAMLPLFYQNDYDPIIMESQFSSELVAEHLHMLQQRNVDGVILFGFNGLQPELIQPWRHNMVVVAHEYPDVSSVSYDNVGAVRLLLDKLRQHGHQHISYLGVQLGDTTTGKGRYQAYLDYCADAALTPVFALGELNYQSGFLLTPEILLPETSAIICASDTIALGAAKYLQQQGKNDIQVCGIGNNSLLNFLFPATFSVELGYDIAGTYAAQQLLAQLNQNAPIQQIIIPGKIAAWG